jgi:uncharacterized membrane protein YphA (DoxX/SURF4 family)
MAENSKGKTWRVLLLLARIALAVIFLAAAYAKLKPQTSEPWSVGSAKTSLSMFAMQVDSYQLLPESKVSLAAHFLPPFELFLGLWLLSGIALRYSSLLTTLLLAGFFGVMVRTFALGLEINCGCFGPGERLGPKTLLRDGSLLALSLLVTAGSFLRSRRQSPASEPAPSISAPQRVG